MDFAVCITSESSAYIYAIIDADVCILVRFEGNKLRLLNDKMRDGCCYSLHVRIKCCRYLINAFPSRMGIEYFWERENVYVEIIES